jgi:hypothetical protein
MKLLLLNLFDIANYLIHFFVILSQTSSLTRKRNTPSDPFYKEYFEKNHTDRKNIL